MPLSALMRCTNFIGEEDPYWAKKLIASVMGGGGMKVLENDSAFPKKGQSPTFASLEHQLNILEKVAVVPAVTRLHQASKLLAALLLLPLVVLALVHFLRLLGGELKGICGSGSSLGAAGGTGTGRRPRGPECVGQETQLSTAVPESRCRGGGHQRLGGGLLLLLLVSFARGIFGAATAVSSSDVVQFA